MARTIKIQIASFLVALGILGAMIVRTSDAAFSGTTSNDNNSFAAGTVALSDNDAGSAKFTVSDWAPGDSSTGCIEVTYSGSITPSAPVKLYASVSDTDSGTGTDTGTAAQLSDDLDVAVTVYAAGETCATGVPTETSVYSGTLAGMPANYATGSSSGWTPVGGGNEVRAFEITVTLGADTANDAQGDSAGATFTWEAQS